MAYAFINPYNFIPLGSGGKKAKEPEQNNGLSGVISYSLLTKTPLFIPNTSNDDAFDMDKNVKDHKSYDFFSYKDLSSMKGKGSVKNELPQPVIPGSEMRGMLRSNYEILTDSCMSAVDDEKILSKRTQEKFQAGLLKRNEVSDGVTYELYKAEDCLARTKGANTLEDEPNAKAWSDQNGSIKFKEIWGRPCYIQNDFPEGSKVEFHYTLRKKGKPLAEDIKKASETSVEVSGKIGYIIKGEAGPLMKEKNGEGFSKQNKHCLHVFCLSYNQANEPIRVFRKFNEKFLTSRLDAVLSLYKQNGQSEYNEYRIEYENFKKGKGEQYFPVYYSKIHYKEEKNDELMLAPACITREVYTRKISDMAKGYKSCDKTGELCPACALFGTLGKENQGGVISRIRVTDLECVEKNPENCFDKEPITLQPLSTPKFNPEFYIKKPDERAVFWTYEYYVDQYGNIHSNTMELNGRKFYWHHPDFSLENCRGEISNLNKTIRPVRSGITFQGKIYFHNISEEELNTLCYLINAGESSDINLKKKKHGYKLGAAKPLGLGSVAMHINNVILRKFMIDENKGISMTEDPYVPDTAHTLADNKIISNFAIMTEFDYLKNYLQSGKKKISYPRTQKDGDIFDWFSKNHTGYRYNKNERKNVSTNMPASRKNMLFKEYLKPMEPETKEVEGLKKVFETKNGGNKNTSGSSGRNTGNRGGRNNYGKKRW